MVKVRGQNYPSISLMEAIARTKLLYEQEGKGCALDEMTIAKALDYSVASKAFVSTISALTKYGLLKSIQPSLFKVSEDAENIILLSRGHPDRVRALRNIAFTPYLFAKIRESTSGEIPDNDTIRCSLLRMGFSPRILESVVHSYREMLNFVQEEETFVLELTKTDKQPLEKLDSAQFNENTHSCCLTNVNAVQESPPGSLYTTLQYQISIDCTAHIQFDGPVTQEGVSKLIALLNLNADVFPRRN